MKKFIFTLWQVIFSTVLPLFAENLTDSKGKPVRFAGKYDNSPVFIRDFPAKRDEFRGVWVAAVENIDFPSVKSQWGFKKEFIRIVDNIKAAGFTAVIFQIRSNCDAFYPTSLAPWSRWISGKEGRHLGNFDPLKFMIKESHKRGLEFHAWLNPYRVTGNTKLSKQNYLDTLAPNNFAKKNPQWVLVKKNPAGNQLFLDPGVPQVISHLAAIVGEIAAEYDIDAIHFDDYFYPYEKLSSEDVHSFRKYNPRKLDLANWRRNNTDSLIYTVKKTISNANRKYRKNIRFGISPFGIWANKSTVSYGSRTGGKETYNTLFADTRKWVKDGFVDYIAPQIYWNFDHDIAAYAELAQWWSKVVAGTKCKLYIGIAAYNGGKWGQKELINQIRFNRMYPTISGAAFFSYRSFFGKEKNSGATGMLRYLNQQRKKK